jgi:cation transport regulator
VRHRTDGGHEIVQSEGADAKPRHIQEASMPYNSISDLPKAQTDQYSEHQKEAFLKAFNSAYKEYGGDESRAFAVAHTAAKRAGAKADTG